MDYEIWNDLYFCRDGYYITIYDYALGYTSYTAEEVLDMILSLKESNSNLKDSIIKINTNKTKEEIEEIINDWKINKTPTFGEGFPYD